MLRVIALLLILLSPYIPHTAASTELPEFTWLKANKINLRKGPGTNYPIIWVYQYKGYPMKLLSKFDNWYKLQDLDGTIGWVNANLVSSLNKKSIVISNKIFKNSSLKNNLGEDEIVILRYPDEASVPLVKLKVGVIVKLYKCKNNWCQVGTSSYKGWIHKSNLWGAA